MIDTEIKTALIEFFKTTTQLKERNIIRSSKYIGDIAEYLAKKMYVLELCKSQREGGYDGWDTNDYKYQIKVNNSSEKTNQDIGNPERYNRFILMVTSNSRMFNSKYSNYFMVVYNMDSNLLMGKKYISKTIIKTLIPEYFVDHGFNIIRNNDTTIES